MNAEPVLSGNDEILRITPQNDKQRTQHDKGGLRIMIEDSGRMAIRPSLA